jgi:serine/threonine-protein kinase
VLSPAEVLTKAASNAARAVLMDDRSVEAHTSLAHVKSTQDWDWAGAEQEFQQAIRLDSRYPTAHHWYAMSLLAPLGRLDEAREEMLRAHSLDPTSSIISRDLARIYYYMNKLELALEQCDRTIELNSHFLPAYWMLGFVQARRGEFEEASAAFQRAIQLSPQNPSIRAALGHTHALAGKMAAARRILTELIDLSERRYVSPFEIALLHFAIKDMDGGFHWLGRAFQDRSFELVLLKVDPRLDAIKPDARFKALFSQLGLP